MTLLPPSSPFPDHHSSWGALWCRSSVTYSKTQTPSSTVSCPILVPGCSLKSVEYLMNKCLMDFCPLCTDHNAVNGNPHIKIANWENGTRRVAFLCPYDAPTWLKKAVGMRPLSLCHVQPLPFHPSQQFADMQVLHMTCNEIWFADVLLSGGPAWTCEGPA